RLAVGDVRRERRGDRAPRLVRDAAPGAAAALDLSSAAARHWPLWSAHHLLDAADRAHSARTSRPRRARGALRPRQPPRRSRDDVPRDPPRAKSEASVTLWAWVGLALVGGAGAVARFLIDGAVSAGRKAEFPLGTLLV